MKKKKPKKRKQHYIPRFVLRQFSKDKVNVNRFDVNTSTISEVKIDNSKENIFWIRDFYESDSNDTNEIENRLMKIESEISRLYSQKVYKQKYVHLSRLQTQLLRLNVILDNARAKATLLTMQNKWGGSLFNDFFGQFSEKQIKKMFLDKIYYLIFNVYDFMQNNPGMIDESMEKRITEWGEQAYKFWTSNGFSIVPDADFRIKDELDWIAYTLHSLYISRTVFIEVGDQVDRNFLYTDAQLVEFYGNKIVRGRVPIMWLKVINPKLIIGYIRQDFPGTAGESIFAKDSFWSDLFPGLFKMANSFIPKVRINVFDERCCSYEESNDDQYIFKKYSLNSEEQVDIINGMFKVQAKKEIVFINDDDLLNADKAINKYNIVRVENYE